MCVCCIRDDGGKLVIDGVSQKTRRSRARDAMEVGIGLFIFDAQGCVFAAANAGGRSADADLLFLLGSSLCDANRRAMRYEIE